MKFALVMLCFLLPFSAFAQSPDPDMEPDDCGDIETNSANSWWKKHQSKTLKQALDDDALLTCVLNRWPFVLQPGTKIKSLPPGKFQTVFFFIRQCEEDLYAQQWRKQHEADTLAQALGPGCTKHLKVIERCLADVRLPLGRAGLDEIKCILLDLEDFDRCHEKRPKPQKPKPKPSPPVIPSKDGRLAQR